MKTYLFDVLFIKMDHLKNTQENYDYYRGRNVKIHSQKNIGIEQIFIVCFNKKFLNNNY